MADEVVDLVSPTTSPAKSPANGGGGGGGGGEGAYAASSAALREMGFVPAVVDAVSLSGHLRNPQREATPPKPRGGQL